MPELPDITVYIEALEKRLIGRKLERIRIANPFLVRSVDPPISDTEGHTVVAIRRVGKANRDRFRERSLDRNSLDDCGAIPLGSVRRENPG